MKTLCFYTELNVRKIAIFFKISKFILLCKVVAMLILQQFLSAGHIMSNLAKQESYL